MTIFLKLSSATALLRERKVTRLKYKFLYEFTKVLTNFRHFFDNTLNIYLVQLILKLQSYLIQAKTKA